MCKTTSSVGQLIHDINQQYAAANLKENIYTIVLAHSIALDRNIWHDLIVNFFIYTKNDGIYYKKANKGHTGSQIIPSIFHLSGGQVQLVQQVQVSSERKLRLHPQAFLSQRSDGRLHAQQKRFRHFQGKGKGKGGEQCFFVHTKSPLVSL